MKIESLSCGLGPRGIVLRDGKLNYADPLVVVRANVHQKGAPESVPLRVTMRCGSTVAL